MSLITNDNLIQRDLKHIWHPCSQMKDYENFLPQSVKSARGSHIELSNGKPLIDAISSWWCKSLGHNHPRLKKALQAQIEKFEHVILANTTNETIVQLSEKLCALMPSLNKVFFAGDGSCAVEVALKMSLHSRLIKGDTKRKSFITLQNGYHGETVGALSVSDLGIYKSPYESLCFECYTIKNIPYVTGREDPLWVNCHEQWQQIEKSLELLKDSATAIIVEPIIQGAGGMLIYSQDFLKRLSQWAKQNDIHLIADEIMTGLGRTGKMLACEHARVEPDFVCLSKGLTSGWMPFSAVLTTNEIYEIFYNDYLPEKSFLHSHTFSGNALGASLALEVFNIMEQENICDNVQALEAMLLDNMLEIAQVSGKLHNIRSLGGVVAADLIGAHDQRLGYKIYQKAMSLGALLRPLGNTLYWLPPLNISPDTLDELKAITLKAINLT